LSGYKTQIPPIPYTFPHTVARLISLDQEARKQPAFDPEAYASRLDASHASLAPLGISAETLKAWKAGYSNSGTNRGRLAIALHDRDGNILGFAGRSLSDEQPSLTIPNGINPQEIIFGGDRVEQSTLYLVRDVLDVLKAHESGVANCVCFLTDITALQVEMLAALMATKHCETVELFQQSTRSPLTRGFFFEW
jgi:hypothetical protein